MVTVTLPAGELIECRAFARAIAQAIHPTVAEGATGLECITGKLIWRSLGAARVTEVSLEAPESEVPARIDASPYAERLAELFTRSGSNMAELSQAGLENWIDPFASDGRTVPLFPAKLSGDERQLLETLLGKLPPLVWPVADDFRRQFLKEFFCLEETQNLNWVPEFANDVVQRRRQEAHYERRMTELAVAVTQGRLSACDSDRHEATCLKADVYIPRSEAVGYLNKLQIPVATPRIDEPGIGAVSGSEVEQIRKYYLTHTAKQTAAHFGLKAKDIANLQQKHRWGKKGNMGRPKAREVAPNSVFNIGTKKNSRN